MFFSNKPNEDWGEEESRLKSPSNLWRYVFVLFVIILLYQFHRSWDESTTFKKTDNNVPKDSVVFFTIEEKYYGGSKKGFDSLLNSLRTLEHDEDEKKVKLKFEAHLPKDNSKVMFVYDKGFSSYEKYMDVVSMGTFPYQYRFKGKPLVEIQHVDKNGDIYLLFKGKKIHLKPNQSYQSFGFDDFHLSRTKITNHGFYKKKNFTLLDAKK